LCYLVFRHPDGACKKQMTLPMLICNAVLWQAVY